MEISKILLFNLVLTLLFFSFSTSRAAPVNSNSKPMIFREYIGAQFAECIGRLLFNLKQQKIVPFASIALSDDESVQAHYMALWKKYGHLIDYVNFQFYAYDKGTAVSQFLKFFGDQSSNYKGGNMLFSFGTDGSGGLSLENSFFEACKWNIYLV
ncbi:hypothetical protein ACOSP7_016565 [Xanthoceras sorbifolium]|uniref:Uncharacterized protein n=1 Tax=Xanthoceras sorbifolium TaxID=99658 RepID=A0ABQ8HIP0_9ROSI|nr:hypothetical protein JRO89_XS10G0144100 [Xanthoceras sorbifolium]